MVGSKVMALSNRYSCLERRDLLLTEWRFNINSKENSVWKLVQTFEGDPTVGSKVMAVSNLYTLERQDLPLTEWRFNINSKENSVRKLL
jgi:hypothetical protein